MAIRFFENLKRSIWGNFDTAKFAPYVSIGSQHFLQMKPAFLALIAILTLLPPAFAQDAAQPQLPTKTLTVNEKKITAEIADKPMQRTMGLMFREKLDPDSGMLFIMPRPGPASFWMKNTKIPLSVAYINDSGMILEIHDLKPHDETPVPSQFSTILYALEMDQGWFTKNGILPGDTLRGLPVPRGY